MIEVKNLTKSYNGKDNILKGVTLGIPQNEFVVILGASGSGKSTLLNCISGLERPTGGKVIYGDVDITALTDAQLTKFRKDTIGFVFQQYYLIPTMTVEKNVRMCAELVGNKDYAEIIAAVGLKDKAKKYPSELSGGEQQRVSVARALAKNPKVLFLDEPTGALDEETGRQLLEYLCKLRGERGFTMIMVTHNQNIAETANTVIKMNSGNIVGISSNETVKTAYEIGW